MNFNKINSSEKFDYMMLSRLIQDAKYFIEHPDLKHLWVRTLDKHIKEMKEQYAKLDPKPEWTSLEDIKNLAQQMKEAYKNHWNEVHPDNKIKSSEQPTTPKPTEVLPTNMQWAWEPKANTWIAVMKDNPIVTPPTYNPNNITNTSNYTTTTYTPIKATRSKKEVKSSTDSYNIIMKAKKMSDEFYGNDDSKIDYMLIHKLNEDETDIIDTKVIKKKEAPTYPINSHEYFLFMDRDTGWDEIDYNMHPTSELKRYYGNEEQVKEWYKEFTKQSSCLAKFLDVPQYSKEIKIEAGLIKKGLVKYAGFDFNRGTKYAITTKGLEALRKVSEAEHNETQNEREKLAYLFGFNTDEASTLDTTGKVIKNSKKWTICEADGTELGEVEAENELDAKVKFGIEYPEYADSLSICAKEVKAKKLPLYKQKDPYYSDEAQISLFKTSINDVKRNFEQITGIALKQFCLIYKENNDEEFKKIYDKITDYISKKYNYNVKSMQWFHSFCDMIEKQCNKIDAKYEETTETHLDYPNPSETPHDDVIIENHTGWVNTAHLKNKSVYRKLFILAKMLEDYRKKELIRPAESEDDNVEIITGDAKIINELEHKIKDLGFYCEPVLQSELPETGLIYSLKIFLDEE